MEKTRRAVYILSVKEWNLDGFLRKTLWQPFKWLGQRVDIFNEKIGLAVLILVVLLDESFTSLPEKHGAAEPSLFVPIVFSGAGVLLVLKAFAKRNDALRAWVWVALSQFFMAFSILSYQKLELRDVLFYLGGSLAGAAIGFFVLQKMKTKEGELSLGQYHGHAYEHPVLGVVFLLSCLAVADFPITPTFVGVDLMFSKIADNQPVVLFFWALHFLFIELALIRVYCRVFLGQHGKMYHPVAFKSS